MPKRERSVTDVGRRRVLTGLGALGASTLLPGCDSLSQSDRVQNILGVTEKLTYGAQRLLVSRDSLAREFDASQIAPTFRANGTTDPKNPEYLRLAGNQFIDWRLRIDGKVGQPKQFSLDDLKAMPARTQITRHDCVEGWSCIGEWTGAMLGPVLDMVEPASDARFVVFHCADHPYGRADPYYESIDLTEAYHPQTLLAYGLNGSDVPIANGAPLRLRAERQLGYKMAKYIMRIELVENFQHIHGGNGGYWEDRNYEWWAGM